MGSTSKMLFTEVHVLVGYFSLIVGTFRPIHLFWYDEKGMNSGFFPTYVAISLAVYFMAMWSLLTAIQADPGALPKGKVETTNDEGDNTVGEK